MIIGSRLDAGQLDLLVERMMKDWDRMVCKKPWNVKDTTQLHSLCGGYIHFHALFKASVPEAEFQLHSDSLKSQFLLGFLDADLEHALTHAVPPGDLASVGFLRST